MSTYCPDLPDSSHDNSFKGEGVSNLACHPPPPLFIDCRRKSFGNNNKITYLIYTFRKTINNCIAYYISSMTNRKKKKHTKIVDYSKYS